MITRNLRFTSMDIVLAQTVVATMFLASSFAPIEAKALPFEPTPDGFVSHLNSDSMKWGDNGKRRFYNPRECYFPDNEYYACNIDLDETTSLGKRTCANYIVDYNPKREGQTFSVREVVHFPPYVNNSYSECSEWEKVSDEPRQLQNNTALERLDKINGHENNNYNTSINMYVLVGSLFGSFLAGCLFGVILRGIAIRRG